MVKRVKGGWKVFDRTGRNSLSRVYKTRKEAEARLAEIEQIVRIKKHKK